MVVDNYNRCYQYIRLDLNLMAVELEAMDDGRSEVEAYKSRAQLDGCLQVRIDLLMENIEVLSRDNAEVYYCCVLQSSQKCQNDPMNHIQVETRRNYSVDDIYQLLSCLVDIYLCLCLYQIHKKACSLKTEARDGYCCCCCWVMANNLSLNLKCSQCNLVDNLKLFCLSHSSHNRDVELSWCRDYVDLNKDPFRRVAFQLIHIHLDHDHWDLCDN